MITREEVVTAPYYHGTMVYLLMQGDGVNLPVQITTSMIHLPATADPASNACSLTKFGQSLFFGGSATSLRPVLQQLHHLDAHVFQELAEAKAGSGGVGWPA